MFLKALKSFLLCYFIFNSIISNAQSDSLLKAQMKFDLGLVRDKNRHLWPIIYKHKNQEYKDLQLIFTIYRKYQTFDNPTKHSHFLPFFWYDSNAAIKDIRIGTLFYPNLFRIISDTSTQSKSFRLLELAPEINFLNITKSKTGLYTQNNFFFFIWGKNDVVNQKSSLIVFPLYWYYQNKYRTSNTFFPLYRFVKIKDKDELKFVLYPTLYFYKKENSNVRHSLALLFYTKKYDQGLARKTVLFPLLFSNNNYNFRKFTLLPLLHYDQTKHTSSYKSNLVITPLFWHQETKYTNRNILFPIYWQKTASWKNDSSRITFLAPIYYSYVSSTHKSKSYIPIVWYKRSIIDTSLSVIPFFYSSSNNQNKYHALFPFYLYKNNLITKNKTLAVTPFYWQTKAENYHKYLLIPFWNSTYYATKNDTFLNRNLIPFVFYKSNKYNTRLTVIPFYYKKTNSSEMVSKYIFPIYYSNKDKVSNFKSLLPLYFYHKTKTSISHTFVPIWFKKNTYFSNNTTKSNLIFPLFYSYKSKAENTKLNIPDWDWKSKAENILFIFPIIYKNNNTLNTNSANYFENTLAIFPFYFKNEVNNNAKTIGITPLYWANNHYDTLLKTHQATKTLFPIWWYNKTLIDSNLTKKSNTIFPLYFSKLEGNYQHQIMFPIVWKFKDSSYKSLTVFPFYQNYSLNNKSYQLSAYTPLVWRVKGNILSKYFIFPVVWHNNDIMETDTISNTVVFPFYWHFKNQNQHNTTIFPIFWKYANQERKSITVLPFIHFSQHGFDSNATKNLAILPLFYKKSSLNLNSTTFIPLYFRKRSLTDTNTIIFPVWYSFKNSEATTKMLFPIYLRNKGDGYKTTAITPLFWNITAYHDYQKNVLFPIWWSKSDSISKYKLLIPFYYREKYKNGNSITGITPLFWNLTAINFNKNVLFPIWWSKTDSISKYKLLIPFYYREKYKNGNSITGITPIFWNLTATNFNKNVLFPIWWSKTDSTAKTRTFVPLFHYKTNTRLQTKNLGILPLFWYHKDSTISSKLLFPIWYNLTDMGKNASKTNYVFPNIYNYKSKTQSEFIFYPLVFAKKTESLKSFVFAPFYFRETIKELHLTKRRTMLTPFVWINKDSSNRQFNKFRILPIYWHKHENGEGYAQTSNTLFPIYFDMVKRHNNIETERKHVLFPIVWSFKRLGKTSLTIFPIYHHNSNYKGENLAITPLFWKINNAKKNQNLLWPLYNYNQFKDSTNTRFNLAYILYRYQKTNKVKSWNVAWPLVQRIKGNNYSYFHAAPIVWYKKSDSMNYLSIQPLFFNQKTNDFKRFQLLWQLYSYKNTFNAKTTHSFLWRTFYTTHFTNGDYENRLLYKVFVNNKIDSNSEQTLLPFYSISKQKNGDYYKGYFLSIYQKSKTQIPNTNYYYVEEKILWYIRLRSNFNYLKQNGIIANRKFK